MAASRNKVPFPKCRLWHDYSPQSAHGHMGTLTKQPRSVANMRAGEERDGVCVRRVEDNGARFVSVSLLGG